jgi:tellurite resistance protein TehA-like permease
VERHRDERDESLSPPTTRGAGGREGSRAAHLVDRSDLDAGAFAFVMATGIVSIAAALEGFPALADALLGCACLAWLMLAVVVARRTLRNPDRRPRLQSFAIVAATAVLGARITLAGKPGPGLTLWALALLLWIGLAARRPTVREPVGGSLLLVVATQSLAVLAALLAPRWTPALLVVALASWALGLVLYPIVLGSIVVALSRRWAFAPDLWIVMGAAAISTLAASELLLGLRALDTLSALKAALPDVDLAIWSLASVLVVPLLAADLTSPAGWRYSASRWSSVFPLGMYAAASSQLGKADGSQLLTGVGRAFFVVAFVVWGLALLGLARRSLLLIRSPN